MSKHPALALVALCALLGAGSAEARFGKRAPQKAEHEAAAPGEAAPAAAPRGGVAPVVLVPSAGWVGGWSGDGVWGPVGARGGLQRRTRLVPEGQGMAPAEEPPSVHLGLTTDVGAYAGGLGLGFGFVFEGEVWGLTGRLDGLALPTDDGTAGADGLGLLSLKPALALIHTERARLRLVAGLDAALAPDAVFLGPGFGFQLEACLLGPLDIEALAELTPLPFTRLDLQAGLALRLGPLALRGGWRRLMLNDQGRVDGAVHEDVFNGPFLGMGLHF